MPSLELQESVSLAPLTTFGVGGPARFFAEVRSEQQILQGMSFARQNRLPVAILGGGSNLLVHDEGFPGLVLHMAMEPRIAEARAGRSILITASAGLPWDELVLAAVRRGLAGMECLAGIPGLTGASPVQNIGAYGQEVAETVHHLRAFDRQTGHFVQIAREECGFAYRSSRFNTVDRDRFLITSVTFQLEPREKVEVRYADLRRRFGEGATPSLMEVYRTVREIRAAKGMLIPATASEDARDPDTRSAGSFFKNPIVPASQMPAIAEGCGGAIESIPHWEVANTSNVKLAAAWLVQSAGFPRGFVQGNVGISSRHSLALINRTGRARYAEVAALRDNIREAVLGRFGVRLEQEPIELGRGIDGGMSQPDVSRLHR